MENFERPVAFRATAFIRPSKWLHRPVRAIRYDAYWRDGRLEFGVDLFKLLRGMHTTDSSTLQTNLRATCPEVGRGRWVHESGSVMTGPVPPEPMQGTER
ncbi:MULTISPECIES: hypothetical protein [unclassified Arthrobacter]|uniref:hypothetical protein n=1 Tax=unclassified Arthrobacter TaxID=235627 RepID=UPI0021050F66|nr:MULTISPECIES: hypothetical protein [unclassified Arthrobacter]MCQ1948147.1 hypothetical protein [Arthrobacter sp. zg-Y1116]MCQ1988195.1 hypothetical protein [Arthrobacter sp. zg-Y844]